jgi:hypothetical protein
MRLLEPGVAKNDRVDILSWGQTGKKQGNHKRQGDSAP